MHFSSKASYAFPHGFAMPIPIWDTKKSSSCIYFPRIKPNGSLAHTYRFPQPTSKKGKKISKRWNGRNRHLKYLYGSSPCQAELLYHYTPRVLGIKRTLSLTLSCFHFIMVFWWNILEVCSQHQLDWSKPS